MLTSLLTLLVFPGLLAGAEQEQASPQEVVQAVLEWEPGTGGLRGTRAVELSAEAPPEVRLPEGLGDARYASIELGDRAVLMVVVDLTPEQERIWFDRDFDRDFGNDPYSAWERSETALWRTETILVPFTTEEEPVPVEIYVSMRRDGNPPSLSLSVRAHKVGEVILGGRLRRIALRDDSNRLRFDEGGNVVLLLDVDGDGVFAADHGSHEHLHLGDPLRLGEEGWSFRVTDAAGTVVEFLREAAPPPLIERKWMGLGPPVSPYRPAPPAESVEALVRRFEAERKLPYAERYETIRLLGWSGSDEAFALLVEAAQDRSSDPVRIAAVNAMGNGAYLEAHGAEVVALTKHKDQEIAAAAIHSLYKLGHPGLEELLLPLLESKEPSVAAAAAQNLAYLDTPSAHAAIEKRLRREGDAKIRYAAYLGLRTNRGGPPVEWALAGARDAYPLLCALALKDLLAMDHPETRALALAALDETPLNAVVVDAASLVLVAAGDGDSVKALLAHCASASVTQRNRLGSLMATLRSPEAVAAIVEGLSARDAYPRLLSAQILAGIHAAEVVEALVKQLKREKDLDVQIAIIDALGAQADAEAIDAVLRVAKDKGPLRSASLLALARIGMGDPKVQRFLLGLLSSNTERDRIFAIDAAAASGDLALGRKLLPNLSHEAWVVRLAAVQALRALRSPDWVEPLILCLEQEDRPRVQAEIAQTLFELTGVNIRTSPEMWKLWWKEQGQSFEMPAKVPTVAKEEAGGTVSGGFYGLPIDSDRVSFVIDQSGSMSARDASGFTGTRSERPTRLEQAVAETIKAIAEMDDRAMVNVIFFESTVHAWEDGVVSLSKGNREKLTQHLQQQRPMGGTNLYDGLELALIDPEVDTVILLSDGQPGAGKYLATDDILRAIARVNQERRITIHCVSLGRDSALLERLAAEHGGRYVRR